MGSISENYSRVNVSEGQVRILRVHFNSDERESESERIKRWEFLMFLLILILIWNCKRMVKRKNAHAKRATRIMSPLEILQAAAVSAAQAIYGTTILPMAAIPAVQYSWAKQ